MNVCPILTDENFKLCFGKTKEQWRKKMNVCPIWWEGNCNDPDECWKGGWENGCPKVESEKKEKKRKKRKKNNRY